MPTKVVNQAPSSCLSHDRSQSQHTLLKPILHHGAVKQVIYLLWPKNTHAIVNPAANNGRESLREMLERRRNHCHDLTHHGNVSARFHPVFSFSGCDMCVFDHSYTDR